MSAIKNAIWKNFDHTYGPLPSKATEYLMLKKQIEKLEYNVSQKRKLNEVLGDERGIIMDADDRKALIQKRNQLQVLKTELLNNNYVYRNSTHMNTVLQYVFPEDFIKNEPKKQSPEPIRPVAPVQVQAPQKPAPVPLKPSNDAWDLY